MGLNTIGTTGSDYICLREIVLSINREKIGNPKNLKVFGSKLHNGPKYDRHYWLRLHMFEGDSP
jgi:hypothetical protein